MAKQPKPQLPEDWPGQQHEGSPIVSNEEAAKRLGVSPRRFYRLCEKGIVPHSHNGRSVVVTEANLAAMHGKLGPASEPTFTLKPMPDGSYELAITIRIKLAPPDGGQQTEE